ncbi:hypothetical protein [Gordonia paraffinivorans]|uniref:hypothetical protein n=1 Tax=Gordonia paraffinivorans TaxID=175628 RepID=UPI0011B1FFA0|nr:hypothetical protein [Gordonia paraffinivorans]
MSTPETGYTAMQSAIDVLADKNPKLADLVAILREITALLAQDDVLHGLTPNDAKTVGVTLIADLVIGGFERLLWRADVIRTANNGFDDRDAALAAHAHAVALIETHDLPTTD